MSTTSAIAPINSSSWRPGDPKQGWIVFYDSHPTFGWLCRKTFPTREEAEKFAASKAKAASA